MTDNIYNKLKFNREISLHCIKFQYGGGMERYIIDLINGFQKIHVKPTVFSTRFNKELIEYQFINPVRINLSFVPKPLRNILLSFFLNARKEGGLSITTNYTQADVVICGGNHKGYIKTIEKKLKLSDKFKIIKEKKSLSNSKLIIAHSKMMRDELIKFYNVESNKISIIYPPIDTNKFTLPESNNKRSILRKNFGFNDSDIIYLFPSTGHKRKGFDILKKYFENSNLPIKLVVAGTPVAESKNIRSLGYCKNMPELYQAVDYTIMASLYEPFGLVGVESILSGTPVIFSDNMGCLEVLKNNFGYTFSRDEINSLDSAIKKSIEKANTFKHRIENPFDCIDYNPSLLTHIEMLLENIDNL